MSIKNEFTTKKLMLVHAQHKIDGKIYKVFFFSVVAIIILQHIMVIKNRKM